MLSISNKELAARINAMEAATFAAVMSDICAGEGAATIRLNRPATAKQVNACFAVYRLQQKAPTSAPHNARLDKLISLIH